MGLAGGYLLTGLIATVKPVITGIMTRMTEDPGTPEEERKWER